MPTKPKSVPEPPVSVPVDPATFTAPLFQTLPLARLRAHPDNIRSEVGDIAGLTESVAGSGILEPLLVLPPDEDGIHLVVAGHRRLAAATAAGLDEAPCIVRHLSAAEVIEAMLVENLQRSDLTPVEEARAYARLVELDTGITVIAAKVGQTRQRVKARLDLLSLPARALGWVTSGDLTLAEAAALAAALADEPDAVDLIDNDTPRPGLAQRVRAKLDDQARLRALAAAREDMSESGAIEFQAHGPGRAWYPPPRFSSSPNLLARLTGIEPIEHIAEPCHQYLLTASPDGEGGWDVDRDPICAAPLRHTALAMPDDVSPLQVDPDLYAHLDPSRSGPDRQAADWEARRAANAERIAESAARKAFMMSAWGDGRLSRLDPMVAGFLLAEASLGGDLFEVWELVYPDVEPDHDDQIELDYAQAAQDPTVTDQWAWASFIHESDPRFLPELGDRVTVGDGPVLAAVASWLRHVEHLGHPLGPHAREWLDTYDQHPVSAQLPAVPSVDPVPVDVDALAMSPDLADLLLSPMVVAGEVILPTASSLAADLVARGWAEPTARNEGDAMTVYRFTNDGLAVAVAVRVDAEKWGAA